VSPEEEINVFAQWLGGSSTVVEEADEAAVDVGVVGLQLGGLLERRQRGRILAWYVWRKNE
jgi:hypothetical protein